MLCLGRDDILKLLTYEDCVGWVEEGMDMEGRGLAHGLPRFRLPTSIPDDPPKGGIANSVVFFCAGAPGKGFASVRVMGGSPFRVGLWLFNHESEAVAVMDFAHLQIYRTGAAAAVGTKYLARPDASRLAVIGTSRMARAALAAHAFVRKFSEVRVYSRTKENREAFAAEMSPATGLGVEPADSAEAAVRDADVVIVCAGVQRLDEEPAYRGAWLTPGVHVTALGGPADLDQDVFRRADRVVVDDRPEVQMEMVDMRKAVEDGIIPPWDQIDDLPQIVAGKRPARQNPEEITVLRNRGNAVQDLFPAANLYLRAVAQGVGLDAGEVIPPRLGF
jgi:ornithine cyclodeaminase/alanine dehydrogenase-like protein (mu-crystallin family)